MMDFIWIVIQILFGYNLILPFFLFILWKIFGTSAKYSSLTSESGRDYAIIVTAYQHTNTLRSAVNSILKLDYSNYLVYIVADNCDVSLLTFNDPRIVLLTPEHILASNTTSHQYAIERFRRPHQVITIIDSDNLVHPKYLKELESQFDLGYVAVQGVRVAKNLNTTIAALDAARDIYYHFYDGKILFELGSSATLAGSGMAFTSDIYREFLSQNIISGAGFDKVLQAWLVTRNHRIAFCEHAKVYDEKTSKSEQLVQQRSRWINTWIKYFSKGFYMTYLGIRNLNKNQFIFGIILLRPPLFIFILFCGLFLITNLFLAGIELLIWLICFAVFVLSFFISLNYFGADSRIYRSLLGIPKFIYLQILSLTLGRNSRSNAVSTFHYQDKNIEDL